MLHFLAQAVRHYLLAVQFFTRVPLTGRLAAWVGFSPAMLRASSAHLPGVGWLVGSVVAALTALLMLRLGGGYAPLVAAVWGTVLGVVITGAFHEDGLADVMDGLGGAQERDAALRIMKDSRVGAFGAMALVLVLLAKVSLLAWLASMGVALVCVAIFLGHVVSRSWPLLTMRLLPYVSEAASAKSTSLAQPISGHSLATAFAWCFMAFGLVVWVQEAMNLIANMGAPGALLQALGGAVLASLLAWALMWRWFARRLQGFTGDCLGATQQVCELAFYLGLSLAL